MIDIKRRKESITSTQQITKAMKLVSTVKLQKAKSRAEHAKPYFDAIYETVNTMAAGSVNNQNPFLRHKISGKTAVVVITSNRGLAGGYNANLVRKVLDNGFSRKEICIYGLGKKGVEALSHRGYEITADYSEVMNEPLYTDAREIGDQLLDAFVKEKIGKIFLAYTGFINTVVHEPQLVQILPFQEKKKEKQEVPMNYEPQEEEVLGMIIPQYVSSLIYGAMIESLASENGARMQAMDSASNNAQDMISSLALAYNRARQSAITQELTEIISGAEALQ